MSRFRGLSIVTALAAIALVAAPITAFAHDHDDNNGNHLSAVPWVFVGTTAQCAPSPAGSRIVTSAWLGGMGLPDNGGPNSAPATRNDPHLGLLLNKNGLTSDCSSSGATIKGVKGRKVTAGFTLGYDYRVGGHCGAGAPRFNVDTDKGFFFVGCINAPQTPAPQDAQWARTRSDVTACGSECFNATLGVQGSIPVGATIKSIDIVFDEGTDTANPPGDPNGVGLAVLDNIDINGTLITSGSGIQPGGGGRDDDNHGGHDKGHGD
jgi:hypothetical protein